MGSMYMGHVLLADEGRQLLTGHLMKFWSLPDRHSERAKRRDVVPFRPYRDFYGTRQNNNNNNNNIIINNKNNYHADDDDDNDNADDDDDDDSLAMRQSGGGRRKTGARNDEDDSHTPSSLTQGLSNIDCATLTRMGWSGTPMTSQWQDGGWGQRSRSAPPKNAARVLFRSDGPTSENADKKLTKEEYRRLKDQVRNVDNILKTRFRRATSAAPARGGNGTAYQERSPKPGPTLPPETAVKGQNCGSSSSYQGHFETGRLPMHARPRFFPGRQACLPTEPSVLRYAPPTSRPPTARSGGPHLNTYSRSQRPRSTPALRIHGRQKMVCGERPTSLLYPAAPVTLEKAALEEGDFHGLSPQLISQLLQEATSCCPPLPTPCGDSSAVSRHGGKKAGATEKNTKDLTGLVQDDLSTTTTTSGVESDGDDEEGADVSEEEDREEADNDDVSWDSENEGFEPSLDELRRQLPNPRSFFPLRPEKLDAFSTPLEDGSEIQEMDFDASNSPRPSYGFQCPLPDVLNTLDLRRCAREKIQWRDSVISCDALETRVEGLVDRLVDLERMQMLTEDWEAKKPARGRLRRQERTPAGSNTSGSRATSGRQQDRRPPCPCLQPACSGDCLEKRAAAGGQWQSSGPCPDSEEPRGRLLLRGQNRQDVGDHPVASPATPCRATSSYGRRPKTRLISASHVTRPRSSVSDTRGRCASGRQRDFRPASAVSFRSWPLKDFDRLGVDGQQPVPPNRSPHPRPRYCPGVLYDKAAKIQGKTPGTYPLSLKKTSKPSAGVRVLQASQS